MENGPFEDAFPIQNGDIQLLCQFTRGYFELNTMSWFLKSPLRMTQTSSRCYPSTYFKICPGYHVKMWLFGSLVLEMRKLPEYEHLPSRGYLQKTTTSWTTQLTFEYVTY